MPRPLKRGMLGASTIIPVLGWTAIDKYAYMCGSNFYESDVNQQATSTFLWIKPESSKPSNGKGSNNPNP